MANSFAHVSKKDEHDAGRTRDNIGVIYLSVFFMCVLGSATSICMGPQGPHWVILWIPRVGAHGGSLGEMLRWQPPGLP